MPGVNVSKQHRIKNRIDTTMDVDKLNMANMAVEVLVKMMEFRWFYRPSVYQVLRSDSTFGPLSIFNCVYFFLTPLLILSELWKNCPPLNLLLCHLLTVNLVIVSRVFHYFPPVSLFYFPNSVYLPSISFESYIPQVWFPFPSMFWPNCCVH